MQYMATRNGVERIDPGRDGWQATKRQKEMIKQILRDFPLSRGIFEYEDYLVTPTRSNASEFITRALEDNYDRIAKMDNYLNYIATRPRAQRIGSHGLFTGAEDSLVLAQIAEAVAMHPGNVWLPIISLRREDAARLGYDKADEWKALLSKYAMDMAEAMKIPWEDFRWYAAFHDEAHHPHVHMVCFSADPSKGFLTKQGIAQIKSGLAKEIFRQDLTELYQKQTQRRNELNTDARAALRGVIEEMQSGNIQNVHIEERLQYLADRLRFLSGKKQYGYLKAPLKAVVDEIVDELAKDPRVASAYDLWYELREDVLRTYKDDLPERLPLSEQKEFKRLKNLVIEEAVKLGQRQQVFHPDDIQDDDPAEQAEAASSFAGEQAKQTKGHSPDESNAGQGFAQYALGKKYRDGQGVERNIQKAVELFTLAAKQGNSFAAFALGKMYLSNVEGCDPRHSFHWTGSSERLYVFEAPIDLLAFLTLYPEDWQRHSYVALCGTAEHAMLWMLEQNPKLQKIILCLDHDAAGIEAAGRLTDILREHGYTQAAPLRSINKDWDEDLKEQHGLEAQPPEEHPQLIVAGMICERIGAKCKEVRPEQAAYQIPRLLQQYQNDLHWGRFEQAMDRMETMSALALSVVLRECRQMGTILTEEQGALFLKSRIHPHQNRGSLKTRATEIDMEFQSVLAKDAVEGIRTDAEKKAAASAWLELAISCAKVPVKYEADELKRQQKEEKAQRETSQAMA